MGINKDTQLKDTVLFFITLHTTIHPSVKMELQPGEEPTATVVQPSAPQVVFDTTKKEKKACSESRLKQLDAARKARLAKREAEKRAMAAEQSTAQCVPGVTGQVSSGGGSETPGATSVPAATELSVPAGGVDAHQGNADGGPGADHGGDGAEHGSVCADNNKRSAEQLDAAPAAKKAKVCKDKGKGKLVASSTFNMSGVPITDPVVRDIREGKRKPMLWSCEPLDSLVQAKIQ